ncbi:hypothetical protein TNIN_236011 [Trichonephila inaurata madagascariensis]|uniref:Uncharacterized protein n=1 Tax=Trichonephila inaurata madagascariensis TaxID=2747483 RepID=A0A8X6Y297_9ARAC|nr:hypothetical protein TNIN_236011 [Trichonephila inaurata madagascariensis]
MSLLWLLRNPAPLDCPSPKFTPLTPCLSGDKFVLRSTFTRGLPLAYYDSHYFTRYFSPSHRGDLSNLGLEFLTNPLPQAELIGCVCTHICPSP